MRTSAWGGRDDRICDQSSESRRVQGRGAGALPRLRRRRLPAAGNGPPTVARPDVASFPAGGNTGMGNPNRSGDVLFFVHGFNVSEAAAREAHPFGYVEEPADQGWNGLLVSYDWPSSGLVFAYLADRENARAAANALVSSGSPAGDTQQGGLPRERPRYGAFDGRLCCAAGLHLGLSGCAAGLERCPARSCRRRRRPSVFSACTPAPRCSTITRAGLPPIERYDKALTVSEANGWSWNPGLGRVDCPTTRRGSCARSIAAAFRRRLPQFRSSSIR